MSRSGSKAGEKKQSRRSVSALNFFLLLQLILMFILSMGITQIISTSAARSSDDYMLTIADERSRIIRNYVESAENTLSAYSHAGEIHGVLENPGDKAAAEAAQKYTEEFSDDIVNLEGIYVSTWDTKVLAHTNRSTVGVTTRTGDYLKELQQVLKESGNSVYNTGIITSPATQKQVVSMYRTVCNSSGEPAGFVGLGIYTDGLVRQLDSISEHDVKGAFYTMLDLNDMKYIFHEDKDKISTEAANQELLRICEVLKSGGSDRSGKFSYNMNGQKYISVYSYMSDLNWLFMIDATEAGVYRLSGSMRGYMIVFSIFCFILIVLFNVINKKREDTAKSLDTVVEKHEKTRESLTNAVYNDFLTELRNRISFSSDFEAGKVNPAEGEAYYFALFNIKDFSSVNIAYGEEAGDMILITTAKLIHSFFPDADVYRTGSDEFLVAKKLKKDLAGQSEFLNNINIALLSLSKPFEIGDEKITVPFEVAVASKSKNVNISVLPTLKNIMRSSTKGAVSVTDLDVEIHDDSQ
jgi:GGDEF domain-containing protein